MSAAATSTPILFIDALVQDIDTLLSTIDPSIEVILLNNQQDGLTQIANALAGRSDIDAVHVISHGGPGSLQLGNGEITEATLAGQAEQLAQIRAALSDSADLMLYGCNVADGTNGASFIQALANATGADVAASIDLTGSTLLGGDWALEAHTGNIEAATLSVTDYDATLSPGAGNALYTGMGGAYGFGENTFTRNDDGFTSAIDLTSVFGAQGVKFGAQYYTNFYINNNGMITFGSGFGGFTPNGLQSGISSGGGLVPAIAAFWTDIDTRGTTSTTPGGNSQGTNMVYWDIDPSNGRITITWDDVGEYSTGSVPRGAFQIRLENAGSGNINFEIRYEYASTLASHSATAGWNTGVANGTRGVDYYEISGGSSGTVPFADLDTTTGNGGQTGVWYFGLRGGSVIPAGSDGVINGPASVSATSHAGVEDSTTFLAAADFTSHYSDGEGDALVKIQITSLPANGSLRLNGTAVSVNQEILAADLGNLSFVPNANFNGSAVFNWKAYDGHNYSTATTFTLNIANVNDPVSAVADTASVTEKGGVANATGTGLVNGSVTSNDTDIDSGDSKTVTAVSFGGSNGSVGSALAGAYGDLLLGSNGNYTYTLRHGDSNVQGLKAGDVRTEVFTYTVTDSGGTTSTSTLTVTVNGANDNPTTASIALSATEAGGVDNGSAGSNPAGNLLTLGGATDPDSGQTATLTVTPFTAIGTYGTLSVLADGSYTYTLDNTLAAVQALRTNSDTLSGNFSYTVKDSNNLTATNTISVTIHGANDTPVSVDDHATAIEAGGTHNGSTGQAASGSVLLNDTDVDSGDTKTITAIRTGDTEGAGTAGSVGSALVGAHGTLTLNANGTYTYVVNENDAAVQALKDGQQLADSFNYTVSDTGSASDIAVLQVAITGRNDAPTISTLNSADPAFSANAITLGDTAAPDAFTPISGTTTAADPESDVLSYDIRGGITSGATSTLAGNYGTLTVNTTTGAWTYTPNEAAINELRADASETFDVRVTDNGAGQLSGLKTLTINLNGINDTPVANPIGNQTYTGSDWSFQVPASAFTDAEGLVLSYAATLDNGNALPDWLHFDTDSHSFSIVDTPVRAPLIIKVTATDPQDVSVASSFTLDLTNQAPTTTDDSVTIREDGARILSLNDFGTYADSTHDAMATVKITALPMDGTLEHYDGVTWTSVSTNDSFSAADIGAGHLRFTPAAEGSGNAYATIGFAVGDGLAFSTNHSLTVNVTAANDAPSGSPSASLATGTEDTPYTVSASDLLAGFSDADGNPLSVAGLRADHGSVVDNHNGTYTITPTANYSGPVTLDYFVSDGQGGFTPATQDFSLSSVNDTPPTLTGLQATLPAGIEDTAYIVSAADLLQGYSDVEGSPILTGLSADHGSVSDNGNGTYTVIPDANYHGLVTLSYNVDDGQSAVATTQTFTLAAVNDAPTGSATATLADATEDRSYLISARDLLEGFSDADGNVLSITGLAATKAAGGGSAGALTDNGNGTWTFTPAADFNGQVNLSYSVTDGSLTRAGATSFQVTPVDDPVVTPQSLGGSNLSAVIADQWTNVFTEGTPITGTSGTIRLAVETTAGHLKLESLPAGVTVITQGYGNATDGTATSIAFEGTEAAVNEALLQLQLSTPSAATVKLGVTQGSMAYDPGSGHYYLIGGNGSNITWQAARDAAAASTFNGLTGYLATITSADENAFILSKLPATGWIGASDAAVEGTWKWVTGPEAGQIFSIGNGSPVTQNGMYANWNGGEPNDSGNEDYAQFYVGGNAGKWNDLTGLSGVSYYVIEYGGMGETPTGSITSEFTVQVRASNTAPTASDLSQSITYNEGDASVALGDIVVTDADAGAETITATLTLSTPLAGVLTTSGTAIYNADTGVWSITGAVDDVNAALAAVSFVPTAENNTDVTITTLIRDALGTGPAAGTITLDVTPINDVPTTTDDSVTTREDTAVVLNLGDFGNYADIEGTPLNEVQITSLASAGTLEYKNGASWDPVILDQQINTADIGAGHLRFTPAAEGSGNAYATIGFKVSDGTDYSTAHTLTVNVTAVNDAPTGSATATLNPGTEDTTYYVSVADLLAGFSDADGNLLSVVGLRAEHGSVSYDSANSRYIIVPEANYSGLVTLSYSVSDGQGGITAATNTYTIGDTDDAPTLTGPQATLIDDNEIPYTVNATNLLQGFTDVDGSPSIKNNTLSADHGSFTTSNGGLTFVYTPEAGYNGPVTLSYTVTDGSNDVPTTQTFTLTHTNHAPTLANAQADQSPTQGQAFSYTVPANTFADTDQGDTLTYSAELVTDNTGATLDNGGSLPGWLHFDPQTREFTGTPDNTAAGTTLYLRVSATDPNGQTVSDVIAFSVANANDAPLVTAPPTNVVYDHNGPLSINLAGVFSDADFSRGLSVTPSGGGAPVPDSLTYTLTQADNSPRPAWLHYDTGTQMLTGTPPEGTPFLNLKLTATDKAGASASTSFTLSLGDVTNTLGGVGITGTSAEGQVLIATATDANVIPLPSDTVYQWQIRSGADWVDIQGPNSHASTFTLTQAEVGHNVRVQAFYQDGLGYAESPVSPATPSVVANVNQVGVAVIDESAGLGENSLLTASVTDTDGLNNVTIGYQWQRGLTADGSFTDIAGATAYNYTATHSDGGYFLRVVTSYTDNQGSVDGTVGVNGVFAQVEQAIATTSAAIQLGASAPTAQNDSGSAVEAGSGPGSNASGNVISGVGGVDTDSNAGDVLHIQSVRTGNSEGLGEQGVLSGSTFTLEGSHGTLTLGTDGSYTYALHNAAPAVEALNVGDTLTDSFNYTVRDLTNLSDRAVLNITIHGANDAPVVTSDVSGSATASGRSGLVDVAASPASGNVITGHTSDIDSVSLIVTGVRTGAVEGSGTAGSVAASLNGNYGSLTLLADGSYTYTIDPANAAVKALAVGQSVVDEFNFTVSDGGLSDMGRLSITVHGSNDAPVVSDVLWSGVTEDTIGAVSGTALSATDPEGSPVTTFTQLTYVEYGTLVFNTNGTWSYDPSSNSSTFQGLGVGEHRDVSFQYSATDASGAVSDPATVTIRITGANDAPLVLTNILYQDVQQDQAWFFQVPISGADSTFIDPDINDVLHYTASLNDIDEATGNYLALPDWLSFDGTTATFTGSPPSNVFDEALSADEIAAGVTQRSKLYFIRVQAADMSGASTFDYFQLTVHNVNDAPVITMTPSTYAGDVTEAGDDNATGNPVAGTATASGTLAATDADSGGIDILHSLSWGLVSGASTVSTLEGTYGSLTLDTATGEWVYTLNNADSDTQHLQTGQTGFDTFTAKVTDNTGLSDTQTITITLHGTNDWPLISDSSVVAGSVTEAGEGVADDLAHSTTSGTLAYTDADGTTNTWGLVSGDSTVTTLTGIYGSMSLDATTGAWVYTLDNSDTDTQHLLAGATATDTFTAKVTDGQGGYATQLISVSVNGSNDTPVISGTITGTVTEIGNDIAGTATTGATLGYTDADGTTDSWALVDNGDLVTTINGTYGSITLDPNTGAWVYTLDDTRPVTDALKSDSKTESFTVRITDSYGATNERSIVVTINPSNDAAQISGTANGSVTEDVAVSNDGSEQISTSGKLDITDVDSGDAFFVAQANVAGVNGYGFFSINAAGNWTYTANNTQTAIQELAAGDSLTDSITVSSLDGTASQVISVTLHGSNDVPTVGDVSVADNEDAIAIIGSVSDTANDVDLGQTAHLEYSVVGTAPTGVTFNSDGTFSVVPQGADQGLDSGESRVITFDYRANDGTAYSTPHTVTVTINGVNDAPVATNLTVSGSEDDATISGSVAGAVSDIDGETLTYSVVGATPAGLSFDPATGAFSLAPQLPDQQLAQGGARVVTFQYKANDGTVDSTTQTVTINVSGANDAPTVVGSTPVTVSFQEDGQNAAGTVVTGINNAQNIAGLFDDVDTGAVLSYSIARISNGSRTDGLGGSFGQAGSLFTIVSHQNGAGVADDSLVFAVSRNPFNSEVGTYTFRVTATDEHNATITRDVSIVVGNANDAPYLARTIPDFTTAEDAPFSLTLTSDYYFRDIDTLNGSGQSLTYSAQKADGSPLPAWLHFDPQYLTFTGTPRLNSEIGSNDIRVTVTDPNGASIFDVFKITVTNVNDLPTGAVTIDGTFGEGHTLTANSSTLADDETLGTLHYQWQIANGSGQWVTVGTDAATLSIADSWFTSANRSASDVQVIVTYTDGRGTNETVTGEQAAVVTLDNHAPTGSVTLSNANEVNGTSNAAERDVLSAANTLADSDGMLGATLTYQWQRDGVDIAGATNGTYTLRQADVDHTITAVAIYTDDDGFLTRIRSDATNAIINVNDAPVASDVLVSGNDGITPISGSVSVTDADNDALTYTTVGTLPTGLTFNADGSFSYAPQAADHALAAGQSQSYSFNYYATDTGTDGSQLSSATKTVTVTVTGINNAPVATLATETATEDGSLVTGTLQATDADTGATASFALDAPVDGLLVNSDGSYSFDPSHAAYQSLADGETLDVVASFTVTDDLGATDTSTLTVTVTGSNDAPVATLATTAATEDGSLVTATLQATDADTGATASFELDAPVDGLLVNSNGSYSFDPSHAAYQSLADGETLDVVASFTVTDDLGATDTSTLTITVNGTNDDPVASVATATATEDGSLVTGTLQATDADTGATASFELDAPVDGLLVNSDGSYSFDPSHAAYQSLADGETLDVVASFTVTDDLGATDTSTLTITVNGSADAPYVDVPLYDLNVLEDQPFSYAFQDHQLSQGFGQEGPTFHAVDTSDVLSFSATLLDGSPCPAWLRIDSVNGVLYGTPTDGTIGSIDIKVTATGISGNTLSDYVTLTVTPVNDAPVWTGPAATLASGEEDHAYTLNSADLLAGYTDEEGHTLSITHVAVDQGNVTDNSNGTFTVVPTLGYNGTVNVSFQVTDSQGAHTNGTQSFVLTPINHAPSGSATATLSAGSEDMAYVVSKADLLQGFSDQDGDTLVLSGLSADHGTLIVSGDGNTITITPTPNYAGSVLLNYNVTDGRGGSVAASQSFTLAAVNDAPQLNGTPAPLAAGSEDNAYTVTLAQLLDGFSDVEGSPLSLTGSVTGNHGSTVIGNGNGTYTVTPAADYSGSITLSYAVSDGSASTAATRSFTLAAVNDAPVLGSAAASLANSPEDTPYVITKAQLLQGYSDVDGDPLNVSGLTVSHGTVQVSGDGNTFTITPASNYNGPVSLGYQVIDGNGGMVTATQSFTVTGVNDAPRTQAPMTVQSAHGNTPFSYAIQSLATPIFTDADLPYGDTLTFSLARSNGLALSTSQLTAWIQIDPVTGRIYGTPDANLFGSASLKVIATDRSGVSTFDYVTVTLVANAAPSGGISLAGTPAELATLTVDTSALSDTDGLSSVIYAYQWQTSVDGSTWNNIVGATAASYTPDDTMGGRHVRAQLSYTDNRGGFNSLNSSGVVLQEVRNTFTLTQNADVYTATAGNDRVFGLAGNDDISGGYGNDQLYGDEGNDILYGNQGDDQLFGGNGDDWMHGGQGNDLLNGGVGNDTLIGGLGYDTLIGGDGIDLADYSASTDGVTVSLLRTDAQLVSVTQGSDTLSGIENLRGSQFIDNLTGDAGANLISGLGGNDTLNGGFGDDVLNGDDGDDILYGNQDNDQLYGGNGDDKLFGGQNDDLLDGGTGNDTLVGGIGNDTLIGGIGNDTADYSGSTDGVTVTLLRSDAQLVSASQGFDTLTGIENLRGGQFGDTLTGDATANRIDGLGGNDTLNGGAGNDTLSGDDGNDTLYGNQDNDQLFGGNGDDWMHGGQGNDSLDGGAGNDTLNGGVGADLLTGGAGADIFVFDTLLGSGNIDTVADFVSGQDKLQLSATIFTAFRGQIGQTLDLHAPAVSTYLSYDPNSGTLAYDADGAGAGHAVPLAIIGGGTHPASLGHDDILIGS